MKVFVDTSAIIAYYNAEDSHHADAARLMEGIRRGRMSPLRLYITDYVFDEAVTFIECVLHRHDLAAAVGEALLSSPFVIMIRIDGGLFDEAWRAFRDGSGLSLTDCASFAAMRGNGIEDAFAFDSHFRTAGFRMLP